MTVFLAGALQPIFWLLTLSVALWAVRRWFPRHEKVLFSNVLDRFHNPRHKHLAGVLLFFALLAFFYFTVQIAKSLS